MGNGVGRLIELSIPDGLNNMYYEQCISEFYIHYSKNMGNKTRAYDGIMELFGQLSNDDFKMAIVSNKYDAAVKELAQDYFQGYIKVAIGESKDVARKPAPDSVIKALEQLGSAADQAVYVGDSEVDVKTAKNAGLTCIGVTWGFRDREILEREGADYIINKPEELLKVVCD